MKLTDVWSSYEEYTRELTNHSRSLGFTGVAICWILRSGPFDFALPVLLALLLIVVFFILDFLQYGVGALIHYQLATQREERAEVDSSEELEDLYVQKKRSADRWPQRLFLSKLAALSLSYLTLLYEIVGRLEVL